MRANLLITRKVLKQKKTLFFVPCPSKSVRGVAFLTPLRDPDSCTHLAPVKATVADPIGFKFGLWKRIQRCWICSGFTIDLLWICDGSAMDLLWICDGFTMDLLWICNGFAMDLLWLCDGFAMDLRWICYGFAAHLLWICYGMTVDLLWICYGFAMDFTAF